MTETGVKLDGRECSRVEAFERFQRRPDRRILGVFLSPRTCPLLRRLPRAQAAVALDLIADVGYRGGGACACAHPHRSICPSGITDSMAKTIYFR